MQRTNYLTNLRDWLLRPSVRVKIMGIVLGLVLLLGFGITWQVRASMNANLAAQLEERGVSIARDIAAHSTDLILINNTYALRELLDDTIRNNADLRYAFILDANNRLLVHSFNDGFPRGLGEKNLVAPTERASVVILTSDEGPIHDIAAPIFDGRAGSVRVGLTETSMNAAIDALTRQMLLTTLAVSILGVGAAYLLTIFLTRPMRALVGVTQAVARGDLSQKAPPWGDDEIGKLSIAFNTMTAKLAQTQSAMLRRARELSALNAIANAMNAPAPLAETLDRSLRALLQDLDLPAGWVFLFDRNEQIELMSWVGLPRELGVQEAAIALHGCPCTAAIRDKQAIVIAPLPDRCPLRAGRLRGTDTIASHITVPILARDRVLGVLGIASADTDAFRSEEVRLLEAVGHQLGVAVENARLWDDLREKERVRGQLLEKIIVAQEEERKRIARELHDDTGQAITSLMVGLRAASDASDPGTRARFEPLRDIAAQSLESVKRLARELRPALLDDLGLTAALERYVAGYRANYGLDTDLQVTGFRDNGRARSPDEKCVADADSPIDERARRLPAQTELVLYRIVQEALTNIAKHARARNVSVVVECKARAVVAIIEDDGVGFDTRAVLESPHAESKLGLYGMRERAELAGGKLQIESAEGKGTSVFVEIPIV